MLDGLEGIVQIKDDVVVHGKGQQHDIRLRLVLERFRKYNVTLRPEKCKFGRPEVLWFGNIYSRQGMSPDPTKVKIIKDWPAPEDKSAVKSFLQTVQFCSTYMRMGAGETYSDVTKPLRRLTQHGVRFKWDQECQDCFEKLKVTLCSDTVMVNYDTSRSTRLYVDHGPDGVAACVTQRYDVPGKREPEWRPVTHTSRALKAAEKSYSKVEGESLGVLSGIMTNKMYLYGTKFEVVVDHRPLVSFYNSKNRSAPVRVDRHRSKLLGFRFKVKYEPGSSNPCDYGSRHSVPDRKHTRQEREELGIEDEEEDSEFAVNRLIEDNLPEAVTKEMLQQAVKDDKELRTVFEDVRVGKMSPTTTASYYSKVFEELTAWDGVLLKGEQLVIPPSLQADVIALAHEGHGGGEGLTIRLLRERVWFPRLARLTKEYVASCHPCTASVPGNAPAPITTRPMPEGPWLEVAVDFKGPIGGPRGFYLHTVIDTYSRYPEVAVVSSTSFDKLKPKLDETWARHGYPEKVIHDGGPPYNSHEWRKYAKRSGFISDLCTPEHPQSNGLVEKFNASLVKVTHAALAEKRDPKEAVQKFLMMYRSTPHSTTGKTPSQLLMNRKLRLKVPSFIPGPDSADHREAKMMNREAKLKQKSYADKHRRARERKVEVGDSVLIRQKKTTTKPPWNPDPFKVIEVKGTQIMGKRGEERKTRNVEKFKVLKERPEELRIKKREKEEEDSGDEFDLLPRGRRQQVEAEEQEQLEGQQQMEEGRAEVIQPRISSRQRRQPDRYGDEQTDQQAKEKQKSPQ